MEDNVLQLKNVSKIIKGKQIVNNISFSINTGEVLGFLGPNGAGKSTTLRMIVGLSKPTLGNIQVCGYSITADYVNAMAKVGCIIEGPDMYDYMSGLDNLKMLGTMSKNVSKTSIMNAVCLVGLEKRINDKVNTYSLGMKQRLGLAQALIHKPKLLILDEPTNGLDPAGITELRNIIKRLVKEEKMSVLISSHLISEIELMCNKVTIIKNGNIIKNASIDEIVDAKKVLWVLDNNEKGQYMLKKHWNIDSTINKGKIEASIDLTKLSDINCSFQNEGLHVIYVYKKQKTLEELFLNLTEENEII